jgi:hypothetical protein
MQGSEAGMSLQMDSRLTSSKRIDGLCTEFIKFNFMHGRFLQQILVERWTQYKRIK